MTATPATIEWAMDLLRELEGLDGFPRTQQGLLGAAKGLLDIVQSEEHAQELMLVILRGCVRFPKPVEIRELYSRRHLPADGLMPGQVEL